jgi:hypothetical protein
MKKTLLLTIAFMVFIMVCGGCAAHSEPSVNLNELVSAPEQFNGKTVTVDGIYINGWEFTILTEGITFTVSGDSKELKAVGDSIWFAGFLSQDIRDRLYSYTSPGAGPQRYGKIRVTGLFESGGKYGNMNSYKYRITVEKAELLDWTPPE